MLLAVESLHVSYGVRALQGVDLVVEDGSVVALLRANGAGKTTTLRTISGCFMSLMLRRQALG
jgi:branched-chain amino acid transport system ATP-binding protein